MRRSAVVGVAGTLLAGVVIALWVADSRSSGSSSAGSSTTPTLTGVRSVSINSVSAQAQTVGIDDDLTVTRLPGELDGPHYTLGVLWTAIGTSLSATDASDLNTTPVRAPRDQQLVVVEIDPHSTYAAFGHADVSVTVTVAGQTTSIAQLPLEQQANGLDPQDTVALLFSAPPSAPLRLRATDAGRAEELDLRSGARLVNSFDRRQSEKLQWSGKTPVAADPLGLGVPVPTELSVENADVMSGPDVATVSSYAPSAGWAPRGSAFLLIPAPAVEAYGDYIGSIARFADRDVFTLRSAGGATIRARPYSRDLALGGLPGDADATPVGFVVPAGTTGGTVTMDLARAQLRRAPSLGRTVISWTRAPAPFTLHVSVPA